MAPRAVENVQVDEVDQSDSEEGGYRGGEGMDREDLSDLAEVPLHEFLKTIAEIRKVQTISAKVELTGVENMDAKARGICLQGKYGNRWITDSCMCSRLHSIFLLSRLW